MLYWRISQSKGNRNLIFELADLASTEAARNVVFIGGTGTGKMHLATTLGISGIARHGNHVCVFSTVNPVNLLDAGLRPPSTSTSGPIDRPHQLD